MKDETFKAENIDEIIWLRLNRFRSTRLCENLIRKKLIDTPNQSITEDVIKSKAIGLSSAIDSAIGYWQVNSNSINSKILSRYYFLLQMTIAEQVSSIKNKDDLKAVQRHTENGHGLATIMDNNSDFPENYFTCSLKGGHFYSYAKFLGINIKDNSFEKRPKEFDKIDNHSILINILDLFRRIPELSNIIEEYIDRPPLSFHIGYSSINDKLKFDALERDWSRSKKELEDNNSSHKETYIEFYTESKHITPEYLKGLNLPFLDLNIQEDPFSNKKIIVGKINHPNNIMWHQNISLYRSSYSPNTYIVPLWDQTQDNIIINLTLMYSLSIIVRYLPDIWYRINSGDLNHIGSLIEYYISIFDHTIPLQMLERITGANISIHQPGSLFGPV